MSERSHTAAVILGTAFFFVLAPGLVAGYIPYVMSRWHFEPPLLGIASGRLVGALLVCVGLASLLESFARFAIKGWGTPAPVAPPRRLVVSGQYRHVRNPMYVAVAAIVLGQGLLLGIVKLFVYAAVLVLVFHFWVVAYEEPKLTAQFGGDYRAYREHVRRWWPRLKGWTSDMGA